MRDTLEKYLKRLSESFYTKNEFHNMIDEIIRDYELEGLVLTITNKFFEGKSTYEIGKRGEGHCTASKTIEIVSGGNISVLYELWGDNISTNGIEKLIQAFCGIEYIEKKYSLIKKDDIVERMCNQTIKRWLDADKHVAVFMLDLDHFKTVDDTYNHDIGDSVLVEFSHLIYDECFNDAIPIHQSGDEFDILMPYEDVCNVLNLGFRIRKRAKNYQYKEVNEQLNLTAAMGICLVDEYTTFNDAILLAEKAYFPKSKNSSKQRDSIRMVYSSGERNLKMFDVVGEVPFILLKYNPYIISLYHNVYLDFIRFMVARSNEHEIIDTVKTIEEWVHFDFCNGMHCLRNQNEYDCSVKISKDELLFSIFSGLYINESLKGKSIKIKIDNKYSKLFLEGNEIYKVQPTELQEGSSYETVVLKKELLPENEKLLKNAILINIGYDQSKIREDIFYRVLRIDDRPALGGGLPDFWSATLAELISCSNENSNLNLIFVQGDCKNAPKLCDLLKNIKKWNEYEEVSFEFLSKKTGKKIKEIEECKKKFESNVFFGDEKNILNKLFELLANDSTMSSCDLPSDNQCQLKSRYLERKLSYDKIRLGIADGCCVGTMAEAFPTVLEILRNQYNIGDYPITIDQAGRELVELTNFKIILNDTTSKDVPEYYKEEINELEDYYNNILGSDQALFKKKLLLNNQEDAVLSHIAKLINKNGLKYATRRAILVVSNEIEDAQNISPLGLTSIWIAPRSNKEIITVDFTFSWRTVEAMIGLPYSMYATVRYSEELLNNIIVKLPEEVKEVISIGAITYFANSLHMFLDHTSMEIIRGIINDATK